MMQAQNALIHATSVELLQTITARGEIDALFIETIEAVIVGKLYYCVHLGRLDLQNKLLHVLHSLISASTIIDDRSRRSLLPKQQNGEGSTELTLDITPQDVPPRGYNMNPLLVQTLVDGLSVPSNRPILQHWLDFILMAVPQFQPTLQTILPPLNDCVCRQLHVALNDVMRVANKEIEFDDDISSNITDAELVMLLNGLERLVFLSLAHTADTTSQDEETLSGEKSAESGGLLGYVSTVFSSDYPTQTTDDQLTVRVNVRLRIRSYTFPF